ncbi:2258_t:CDS:1 [Funneliformis caledonium]|uniref:2258_t:CDS:1 n=1 Tax=Funneliformis caledonium TaxID=1117310 RepID=A0A9N8YSX0_9GLOM|nr:2258_t:CDS:1 [Funneliformis caledonium]
MIISQVFFSYCLFLVIFVCIPLVKSKCSCCEKNGHNIRTCHSKDNCPSKKQNLVKSRKFTCICCGKKSDHYENTCPSKNNCLYQKEYNVEYKHTISSRDCFFKIERKNFVKKGEKIKPSCKCARKGDEQCHGIADMLGGPGNCENCMSCSRKMNNDMKGMEKFVKKSDGGVYIVACDNYEYAKTITQIFRPYKGEPTTTVIFRGSPTNYHDEI